MSNTNRSNTEHYSFNTVKSKCICIVTQIGELSEENLKIVTGYFEKSITEKETDIEYISYVNYYMEEMKLKFWSKSYQPYNFKESSKICKELFAN